MIFASGGSIGKSVIKAAEKSEGKVIGSDMDQSSLSETVITSAVNRESIGPWKPFLRVILERLSPEGQRLIMRQRMTV